MSESASQRDAAHLGAVGYKVGVVVLLVGFQRVLRAERCCPKVDSKSLSDCCLGLVSLVFSDCIIYQVDSWQRKIFFKSESDRDEKLL